jgi:hypothetical protein
VYNLASGPITKSLFSAGRKYILGYWYKSGSTVSVASGTVGLEVIKNRRANWIYAERELTSSLNVTISGTGYIDELRFHPIDSKMSTFSYLTGIGLGRSQDSKGMSASFQYDPEQRIKYIRDQQGNIVKAYDYHISNFYQY